MDCKVAPAWACSVAPDASTDSMTFVRASDKATVSAAGMAPPAMPVRPPWGVMGTRCAWQTCSTCETSSVLAGSSKASGRVGVWPLQSV